MENKAKQRKRRLRQQRQKQRTEKFKNTSFGQWSFKNKYYLAAFFIPFMVLLITYIANGVFPFGGKSVMIVDSYHQYVPFFSELRDKIYSGESLFYTWNGGLGINFVSIIAYYLASPLSILALIFPKDNIIEAFTLMIVLKICFSSVTMTWYLKHRPANRYYKFNMIPVIFSCFYALCNYVLAFNWNVMWLDCLVLLPLIIYGLEHLLHDNKGLFYGITLGLAVFSNYYIAIMICMFLCLYAPIYFFSMRRINAQMFFQRVGKFAGYSLLGGGAGAVLILPTVYTLTAQSEQLSKLPDITELYNNFFDFLGQHFAIIEPTNLSGMANIYSGVIVIILIVMYIFHRGLPLKERLLKLILLAFMFISLNSRFLDYFWHGMHFPNNLPGRYSYIYVFLILTLSYDVFATLRKFSNVEYIYACVVGVTFFVTSIFFRTEPYPFYTYIVTGILLVAYMLLLYAYKNKCFKQVKIYRVLAGFLILEVVGNGIYGFCVNGTTNRTTYVSDFDVMAEVRETYLSDQDEFFRMELNNIRGRDDIVLYHLPGLSLFSSTAGDKLEDLVGKVGFFDSGNKFTYRGPTPLSNAMFNIRYVVSDDELMAPEFELDNEIEDKKIYINPYDLSLGFMVNNSIETWDFEQNIPMVVQNNFITSTTGIEEKMFVKQETLEPEVIGCTINKEINDRYYYEDMTATDGKITFTVPTAEDRDIFIYYECSHSDKMTITIDGEDKSYSDKQGHILHLGRYPAETEVKIEFKLDADHEDGNVKLQIHDYNHDVFLQAYAILSQSQWQVTDFDSTHLSGNIQVNEDGIMYTSVPFDDGWTIKVDGETVEPVVIGDALIGVALTAGLHEVTMTFIPVGFIPGLCITLVCVLVLLLIFFWHLRTHRKALKS